MEEQADSTALALEQAHNSTILSVPGTIRCLVAFTTLTVLKAESVFSLMKTFSFNAHLDTMTLMATLVASLVLKVLYVQSCNINTSLTVLYREGFKTASSHLMVLTLN